MEELPVKPAGIRMRHDFIGAQHEAELIDLFQNGLEWPSRRGRLSLHYGYTFSYKTFGIDRDTPYKPFPDWLVPLLPRAGTGEEAEEEEAEEEGGGREGDGEGESEGRTPGRTPGRHPDQVCLQYYAPGTGIPPHVDTHSAFDQLYALSLGAPVFMQFRDGATGERTDVDLPARSMMQMRGDARLHWTHGIKSRMTDTLADGTVRPRMPRWSLTYRWLREGAACECGNAKLCDTAQRRLGIEREYRWKEYEKQAGGEQQASSKGDDGQAGGVDGQSLG